MASSVNKKDITELREAGYLAKEIAHRLPAKGQIVPTPDPHERLTDLAVVPREKPHTGAAAREQPRDSPVIER